MVKSTRLNAIDAALPGSVLSGGGVDAVDTHDPLVALLADGWLTCRFPRNDAPPC